MSGSNLTHREAEALRDMIEELVKETQDDPPTVRVRDLYPAEWREILYKVENIAREAAP